MNKIKSAKNKKYMIVILLAAVIAGAYCTWYLIQYIEGNRVDPDNPYPIRGVDVSSYQGDIDWKTVENQDMKFAFIKATEGSSHVDEKFEMNWKNIRKTDMRAGAYHFMSYDSPAKSQAENFISHVDKTDDMLPPVVDVEFYGKYIPDGRHPPKHKLRGILSAILDRLEKEYGIKPIIYTTPYIYSNYICSNFKSYDIWISAPDFPASLTDGKEWTFLQYSFKGKLKGFGGGESANIDLNAFNGTPWEFTHY